MKNFIFSTIFAFSILMAAVSCQGETASGNQPSPSGPSGPDTPVQPTTVAVTGVTLDKKDITLTEGDNATLTATVSPENATDKNVAWASSDTTIASVNAGQVTAVKAGTATITVTTKDGGKTASCTVNVNEKFISVTEVTLDNTVITLTEGENVTLTTTVLPENATDKNVTWASSDTTIVPVNAGLVTAVKVGTATITVTTKDGGKTASCTVNVKKRPEDGGTDPEEIDI